MYSFDETAEALDEIARSLPEEIYRDLNGGVNLILDEKAHPSGDGMFILGEYRRDSHLGRFINIYYGSFMRLFADLPPDKLRERLRETLTHEFTHHLESMAGERDLEIEDAMKLRDYAMRREAIRKKNRD
ncbi:MAG: metallopeptidase family protein [Clostridiales bacterium]|nr:metallopeptidase family protein [Clostridiales bacterium]